MEAWAAHRCRPACANPVGERQRPHIRQWTASSRRLRALFESNRGRSGHQRDRVEVSGQAGLELLLRMGCAQRLPNGNTLITESSFGRFFEVTKEGEIVWEYVNPF